MSSSSQNAEKQQHGWAKAATIASLGVAVTLIIAKLIAWQLSGSAAVLGSLADSMLDLLGSFIAFIGVRWAAEPADYDHRFGHQKAEPVASFMQIVLISASALYIAYESIMRLITPQPLEFGGVAIGVMVLSLVLTAILIAFQSYALKKSGSLAVEGDRAHYMGDLIANAGTLLALVLVMQFGLLRADGIAGLLAAVFLAHAAWSIGRRAIPQLMDEEASDLIRAEISRIVMADNEVLGCHALRTRIAGQRLFIQLHVEMAPDITLEHAHEIGDRVEAELLKAFPGADIILHQDPAGRVEPHDTFGQR